MGKKKAEPGEIMGIDVRSSAGEFLSLRRLRAVTA